MGKKKVVMTFDLFIQIVGLYEEGVDSLPYLTSKAMAIGVD
jgi:hypothetical protein